MTTNQYRQRIKKYFRLYGSQNLSGIKLTEKDSNAIYNLTTLDEDMGEVGVYCNNNSWFIPLDELTYSELKKICINIESKNKK